MSTSRSFLRLTVTLLLWMRTSPGLKTALPKTCLFNRSLRLHHFSSHALTRKLTRAFPLIRRCKAKPPLQMQNSPTMPLNPFSRRRVLQRSRLASAPAPNARCGLPLARRIRNIPTHFTSIPSSAPTPSTPFRLPRSMPSATTAPRK